MNAKEIENEIDRCVSDNDLSIPEMDLVRILRMINVRVHELETKLKQTDDAARHANNIASCLANGIQPD